MGGEYYSVKVKSHARLAEITSPNACMAVKQSIWCQVIHVLPAFNQSGARKDHNHSAIKRNVAKYLNYDHLQKLYLNRMESRMEKKIVKHPEEGHVYVKCQVMRMTDKAVLFLCLDKIKEGWIPRSQIKDDNVEGQFKYHFKVEIMIPDWLAGEKGFV